MLLRRIETKEEIDRRSDRNARGRSEKNTGRMLQNVTRTNSQSKRRTKLGDWRKEPDVSRPSYNFCVAQSARQKFLNLLSNSGRPTMRCAFIKKTYLPTLSKALEISTTCHSSLCLKDAIFWYGKNGNPYCKYGSKEVIKNCCINTE